jgi:hypothetical protein
LLRLASVLGYLFLLACAIVGPKRFVISAEAHGKQLFCGEIAIFIKHLRMNSYLWLFLGADEALAHNAKGLPEKNNHAAEVYQWEKLIHLATNLITTIMGVGLQLRHDIG